MINNINDNKIYTCAEVSDYNAFINANLISPLIQTLIRIVPNYTNNDDNWFPTVEELKIHVLENSYPFKTGMYSTVLNILIEKISNVLLVEEDSNKDSIFDFKIIIDERLDSVYVKSPEYDMVSEDYIVDIYNQKTTYKKILWITNHCNIIPVEIIRENIYIHPEAHGEKRVSHKWSHIKDRLSLVHLNTIKHYLLTTKNSIKPKDDVYYFVNIDSTKKPPRVYITRDNEINPKKDNIPWMKKQ